MKCAEKSCSVVLTTGNAFVQPLAVIAAGAKKNIADLTAGDLASSHPVCEDCASLHIMCGEVMVSWARALETISRAKQAREKAAKAAQLEADLAVILRDRRAAQRRGAQGLGVLLLAQGLRPSAKLASATR